MSSLTCEIPPKKRNMGDAGLNEMKFSDWFSTKNEMNISNGSSGNFPTNQDDRHGSSHNNGYFVGRFFVTKVEELERK